jgi:DNA-binding PadR family transcriptional regulator
MFLLISFKVKLRRLIYQNIIFIPQVNEMVDVIDAFLRGFEKPIILWLLTPGPKNGYEIMKEAKRLTGQTLKPSMVYPFLYWLEEKGFVVSEWIKKGQRELRCYHLTDKGKGLLMKVNNLFRNLIKRVIADLLGDYE